MFIDIQVGTIATGLEVLQNRSGVSAERSARGGRAGEAKAVGEASQGQGQRLSTLEPGPHALKPLLLLSPDSRPGLGVLWATFYRSKVHRDAAAPLW